MTKLPRIIKVHQLKLGDRFSQIPAAWYGPGVVIASYGHRFVGIWCIKFDNNKITNPPGVIYCLQDEKVRLLKKCRKP
jgi:hypothetical protein